MREMIESLIRAIGRPVRYVAITDEQWANAVKEQINPHALERPDTSLAILPER